MRATRRQVCSVLAVIGALTVGAASLGAYSQTISGAGVKLRWLPGSIVRYSINQSFAPNNNSELVRAALRDAFRTLQNATPLQGGVAAVRFEEAGTTAVNRSDGDCVNLITFTATDPGDILPKGVIAVARTSFLEQAGEVQCGSQVINAQVGQILDADMIFNSSEKFSTSLLASDTYDIESIALHEGGHWLALNHTGIASAAMSPFGDSGEFPVRNLHTDDLASLRAVYGTPGGGAISGRITTTAGQAVKTAHVVANDATTGLNYASALSDQNGAYTIGGLPAGSYRVFVEPLDAPVLVSDMASFYRDGSSNFMTTFVGAPVTVAAAEVPNVNVQVSAGGTIPNLNQSGLLAGSTFSLSATPVSVPRGTDASLYMAGSNLSGEVRLSAPKVTLRGPIRVDREFRIADLRVAADAPPGPGDIYFGNSSMTGGLIITVNPRVPDQTYVTDAAAFNQDTTAPHYAPGSMITIFGSDLANVPATGVLADRVPLPTQVGGISVKINDRLAPLFFVGAGQINAMIPFETSGSSFAVTVVAGPQSSSSPVSLPLGSTAPRIFLAGAQNAGAATKGQGAILIANTRLVVAPADMFPGNSRPATAGEFISIFCTGLGRVRGNLASGLVSSGELAETPVQVTIGGVSAEVPFAGLAPNFVGLFQVNARVPSGVSGRVQVVITSLTGGGVSNKALISVQ